MTAWQAVMYGKSVEAKAALDYYRERGWPVDDQYGEKSDRCELAIYAFMAGWRQSGAPDLLKALKSMMRLRVFDPSGGTDEVEDRAINAARAAIAKAEGR